MRPTLQRPRQDGRGAPQMRHELGPGPVGDAVQLDGQSQGLRNGLEHRLVGVVRQAELFIGQ